MDSDTTPTTTHACDCGCGIPAPRRFAPGHDARHKGNLLRTIANGRSDHAEAAAWEMVRSGWGHRIDAAILHALPIRNSRRQVKLHIDTVDRFQVDAEGTYHARANCCKLTATARRLGQLHPITHLARPSAVALVATSPKVVAHLRGSFDQCHECMTAETVLDLVHAERIAKVAATLPTGIDSDSDFWTRPLQTLAEALVAQDAAAARRYWSLAAAAAEAGTEWAVAA